MENFVEDFRFHFCILDESLYTFVVDCGIPVSI